MRRQGNFLPAEALPPKKLNKTFSFTDPANIFRPPPSPRLLDADRDFQTAAPTLHIALFRLSVVMLRPEKHMPTPAEYAANRLKFKNSESARHAASALYPRNAETPGSTSGRESAKDASPPPASGKTPQGRARSSMNALRHGLTARVVVLPSEDMDAYQTFSKEIVDSLDPQTPVERQFAQTVADNQWRSS
jgi:hypothetical protein